MWTFIIISSITFLVTFIISIREEYDFVFMDLILCFIQSTLAGMFSIFISLIIVMFIPSETTEVKETFELEALKDNSTINGSFFLGSGYIDGSLEYVFYHQTENGFQLKQVSPKNVFIKYTNENPRFEVYKNKETDHWINNFTICFECSRTTKSILFIPEGSIQNNYNLDLE